MYEKRFGFHRKPFQAVLTEDDFFESEVHQKIAPAVLHALRSDLGVAVLTGPAGVGKTVTLESFRRVLEADGQAVQLHGGNVRTATDLFYLLHRKLITAQAGSEPPQGRPGATVQRWEVIDRLQRVSDFWGPVIILLDDAHLVTPEVFAELRSLLEEVAAGRRLVRVLISGPLVLEEILAEPAMSDFSQRIRTHVFLEPFRSPEAVSYLHHHVQKAGGDPSAVFDTQAVERIVSAADGLPRCLNLLADECLMVCAAAEGDRVDVATVDLALTRLQHLPYSWNVSLFGSDSDDDDDHFADHDTDSPATTAPVERMETTTVSSSDGVIEIGGPVESVVSESPSLPSNVIEIGAANDSVQLPEQHSQSTVDSSDFEATEVSSIEFFSEILSEEESHDTPPLIDEENHATETDDADPTDYEHLFDFETSADESSVLCADDDAVERESAESEPAEFASTATRAWTDTLEHFSPWEPAGVWPAEPLSIQNPVHETTDSNCTPVFDRYTWCELGRPVPVDQRTQLEIHSAPEPAIVWPPDTVGVAPSLPIPVETIAADDSASVCETGAAVAKTSGSADNNIIDDETLESAVDESMLRDTDSLNPEQSIEQIQQLLETEVLETAAPELVQRSSAEQSAADGNDSGTPLRTASAAQAADSDSDASGDDFVSLSMLSGETDASKESEHSDGPQKPRKQRLFTLPIDIDDVDSHEVGAVASASVSSDVQMNGELLSEIEKQETAEEQALRQYAPQLLRAARSRVVTLQTSLGHLKCAAGAESLSSGEEFFIAADDSPRLNVATADGESDVTEYAATDKKQDSTFSNLFTRLRNLKNRST